MLNSNGNKFNLPTFVGIIRQQHNKTPEKVALECKSKRRSRRSYEFLSIYMVGKNLIKVI